jgi:hypothetical protein
MGEGAGGKASGMSGAESGANGRVPIWAGAAVAALLLAKALVDAQSIADRAPAAPAWQPHVLEFSSAAFFVVMLWPIWRVARRLRPPHMGWPAGVAVLAALSLPLVLAHALWLAGSRSALFALGGAAYRFDWSWAQLLFEWRKDLITLLALAGVGLVLDRLFAPVAPVEAPAAAPFRLAVKDGSRTLLLAADEISHATTAGNYVELATVHGAVLHRATMAALAEELAPHGFVRIHRAHLVRSGAVISVVAEGSGDFAVTLAGGITLPGSRRYRAGLAALGL